MYLVMAEVFEVVVFPNRDAMGFPIQFSVAPFLFIRYAAWPQIMELQISTTIALRVPLPIEGVAGQGTFGRSGER